MQGREYGHTWVFFWSRSAGCKWWGFMISGQGQKVAWRIVTGTVRTPLVKAAVVSYFFFFFCSVGALKLGWFCDLSSFFGSSPRFYFIMFFFSLLFFLYPFFLPAGRQRSKLTCCMSLGPSLGCCTLCGPNKEGWLFFFFFLHKGYMYKNEIDGFF